MATLNLLSAAGYEGLTMEEVAARSHVNKTTLYRWWPSKDALLAAALDDSDLLSFDIPDTGTLRGDLSAVAAGIHRLLTDETTAPIAAAVLAATPVRPRLATIGRAFFAGRLERERPLFDRAIQRGELPPSADPATIMDALAGAIWFRILLRGEPASPEYLRAIVDLVVAGIET
ncbi:AcrR family transcriptional regulator [Nocardia transvalensis]|uniref:AcrR family transcriptional regulator n=1 Tax=Nocardia transvalensis TaxID=37333 RepID=A0A7W9P9Y5_9NOCA|nr:TetR/AcrR family transcriptional regulator [Nocardia transvalensis]MBB5911893.1 AcrR family transcriptional regulator [Nocardia transvalensis]